ncbi:hypothetical protein [Streptococcus acidominimus]|uniref:Uncharacterized protein n=1 Tax=Streptococcus acidominimus TaxID=1326 RepID=A0A4Y9FRI7_STRAI|nr:hypothetical protein [Streptococcus acidominimus]MBF0817858.1 hypothetical protein [Streptococcus acidominimus]MBF0838374.1 hypothetical protein [Streptococcus acidominimus]MBF0846263.1 hypothetical protein [Streptococcus danieliae]TFU31847.1 hypothetical protein E4U01_00045 [Streptococcus acidominimus]
MEHEKTLTRVESLKLAAAMLKRADHVYTLKEACGMVHNAEELEIIYEKIPSEIVEHFDQMREEYRAKIYDFVDNLLKWADREF